MLPIVYYDIEEVQGWTAADVALLMVAGVGLCGMVAAWFLLVVSI